MAHENQKGTPQTADTLGSIHSRATSNTGSYQPERVSSAPQPASPSNQSQQPKK